MLPLDHPDRIQITFDDHRLGANPGPLLPVILAQYLGPRELVDRQVDLGDTPGQANTGDKMMTLAASALAGGDCIEGADGLSTGGTARTLGGTVKVSSSLCAVSGEGMSGNWIGQAASCWPGPGLLERDRAAGRSPSTWTPPSAKLLGGQGGRAPPQLRRRAGLSPAVGRRRRYRRCTDGPPAPGPGQRRAGHRPLPAENGGAGAPRRNRGRFR